jgi:hypothetical protein
MKVTQIGNMLYVDDPNTGQQVFSTNDSDAMAQFIADWRRARTH